MNPIQFISRPRGRFGVALRLALWALGWIVWFLGGFVSFLHAL